MKKKAPEDKASHFFCLHDDIQSLKAKTIIGSIARQFAEDIPANEFADLSREWSKGDIALTALASFLISKLSKSCRYFIILDGLDECDEAEAEEVLKILFILQASVLQISVYCATRPALVNTLRSNFKPERIIDMEDRENQEYLASDMNQFIQNDIKVRDQEILPMILQNLRDGAEGM